MNRSRRVLFLTVGLGGAAVLANVTYIVNHGVAEEAPRAILAALPPLLDVANDLEAPSQALDVTYGLTFDKDGNPTERMVDNQPSITSRFKIEPKWDYEELPTTPSSKISAVLHDLTESLAQSRESDRLIPVQVSFVETIRVPRFPSFSSTESKLSTGARDKVQQSTDIMKRIADARALEYAILERELITDYKVKIVGRGRLAKTLTLDIPAVMIDRLATRDDVLGISLRYSGELATNMALARATMNTAGFETLQGSWIGVIDTGILSSHTLLSGRFDMLRDCVVGGADCNTGSILPQDTNGHGTGMTAIIVGNNNLGANNRGFTSMVADSWRIGNTVTGLDGIAAERAFENAAQWDDVINCSFRFDGDGNSTIALAADAAYNAGRIVTAATGNSGSTANLGSPASARRVLGVGAIDVNNGMVEAFSDRGPSSDNRTKPDVMGVDRYDIANASSTTGLSADAIGTSVATASITSAAALWRNHLLPTISYVDPGQVYAIMVASPQVAGFNNTRGAGLAAMRPNSVLRSGGVVAGASGTSVERNVILTGTVSRIDVALWWPDPSSRHNDIDLQVLDPSGNVVAAGYWPPGVFERVQINTTTPGTWRIRIRSYNVVGTQKVYWALFKEN